MCHPTSPTFVPPPFTRRARIRQWRGCASQRSMRVVFVEASCAIYWDAIGELMSVVEASRMGRSGEVVDGLGVKV